MAIPTASRKTQAALPPERVAGQSLYLTDVSWETYLKLGEALAERHLRMTYDQGALEIMTLSRRHEKLNRFLARMVDILAEELDLPINLGGSTTFQKHDLARALEPDSCWWIANEYLVRDKMELDLSVDPPPDLALEIDITSSSLNRLSIYAALKVPEVWRFDGNQLTFHVLKKGKKKYTVAATSVSFPKLTPTTVKTYLDLLGKKAENMIAKEFRTWVRENLATGK